MKKLLPVLLALAGLGAGVGAGIALKPHPSEEEQAEHAPAAEADCDADAGHGSGHEAGQPCPPPDPYAPAAHGEPPVEGAVEYVAFDKPFVVPVFEGERVAAMMVLSLSVEVGHEHAEVVVASLPRLRDAFLAVLFRHANTGGFDGSFTSGQKMADLKTALLKAATQVVTTEPLGGILVTEILRQDT